MASKILFIEDELSFVNSKILGALVKLEPTIKEKMTDLLRAKTIHDLNDALSQAQISSIEFAESFVDALDRIKKAGNGSEYCWFFIDRNLEEFKEFKKFKEFRGKFDDYFKQEECNLEEFKELKNLMDFKDKSNRFDFNFCKYFNGKEGDYLYIRLRQAGVPKEKICFLTANGEENPFASSDFFDDSKPQFIMKEEVTEESNPLVEYLKSAGQAKISFKYKKIFDNQKIKTLLGEKAEDFIEVLARIEYPNGPSGDLKFDKGDGTLLRNMVEAIVFELCDLNDDGVFVRKFLNAPENQYIFREIISDHILEGWVFYYKKINKGNSGKREYPSKKNITDEDKQETIKYYRRNHSSKKTPEDRAEDYFNKIYYISDLLSFHEHLKDLSFNSEKVPKYIFSYIDNIYTVTSEWSSHAGNPTKVTYLSAEGFRGLVYGMCQILDWLADKYPNQGNNQ